MKKEGKLSRLLGAPMRALSRACDFYVRSMSGCAGRVPMEAAAVGGRGFGTHGPTFSSGSVRRRAGSGRRDEDADELVRAASQRGGASQPAVARSRSVAVDGRIDENAPCEFTDDVPVGVPVRRSRSVAVVGGLAARAGAGKFGAVRKGERVLAK